MSGITLTNEIKANIASYMMEVMLPDMFEGALRERENSAGNFAGFFGISSAGLGAAGALLPLFANPITSVPWIAGLALGSIAASVLQQLVGKDVNAETARVQADNAYWFLVKRGVYCGLPSSTDPSIFAEATRERMANEIENIVPYNTADIASKTSANNLVASLIRAIPLQDLRGWLEAASIWDGNQSGISTLPNAPSACGNEIGLVPVIGDTGVIPFSEKVSPNTWNIGVNSLGDYRWRTLYSEQCYRIEGVTVVQSPVRRSPTDPFIDYVDCTGNIVQVTSPSELVGVCLKDLRILSNTPFNLYVTIAECGAPPLIHQGTLVRFGSNSQSALPENSSRTVRVVLDTNNPITQSVTASIGVDPSSTAVLGSDFTVNPTQVTFDVGNTSGAFRDIVVNALSDTLFERDERIVLRILTATGGAVIGRPNQHVLTIENEWVKEFDFRQGKQGWEALPYWLGTNGIYHDIAPNILGWHSTANGRLYIAHPLSNVSSNTRITEVSIEFDRLTGASTGFYNGYGYTSPSDVQQTVMISFSGEMSKSQTTNMTLANGVSYEVYGTSLTVLQKIILKGSGTNPFV
ncbi:MAG: hypothetical protein SF123_07945 [Chloroflexota bacterium]|nr:hypothetical protein [Chloroflexota bacterium]